MSYLLDTNICIAMLHRKESLLLERFRKTSPNQFFICSVVKAELLFGAYNSQRVIENLETLEGFFSQFISLPFDDVAAAYYGKVRPKLKQDGKVIGSNDLLISCIAKAFELTIITRNRAEFLLIPDLKIETW